MPRQQHIVTLSAADRRTLDRLTRTGAAPARAQTRARILLQADPGTKGRRPTDAQIAQSLAVSARTVARVRAAYCTQGYAAAVERKRPDRLYARKLDGAGEAVLLELACGPAPMGRDRWSLRLLGEALVELHVVEAIAPNTVAAVLNKTRFTPTGCASGVSRPSMRASSPPWRMW